MTLRTMTPAGAMALGAATLVAATGAATTAAGSDSLFQLLQFKIDMFHWYSPPFFSGAGNGQKRLAEPRVKPGKMIFGDNIIGTPVKLVGPFFHRSAAHIRLQQKVWDDHTRIPIAGLAASFAGTTDRVPRPIEIQVDRCLSKRGSALGMG